MSIRSDLAKTNANLNASMALLAALSGGAGNNVFNNDILIPGSCYVAENYQNGNYSRIVIKEKKPRTQASVLELRNILNRMILSGDTERTIEYAF